MIRLSTILLLSFSLSGCFTTPEQETRPVLTCTECGDLKYYGPQTAPPEAPGVSVIKSLVSGGVIVAGYGLAADAAKSIVSSTSKKSVVTQPAPTVVNQPEPTVVTQPPSTVVTQPAPTVVRPEVVQPTLAN